MDRPHTGYLFDSRRVEGVSRLGMTITISMGIPGLDEIRPGTHMCALYSGPAERDRLLFPFLREGIREGDKCLCLIDDAEVASSVRDQVEGQPGGDQPPRSEQLDVSRTSDAYLESGRFSAEHMRSFLSGRMMPAAESDFPMLRAAGEMSWVLLPQPGGADDLFVYESAVNKIVDDKPAVFLCMYDLDRFGISMLVDVLKTHPKVLLDGMVLDNPHYLTPTEYLAAETSFGTTRYPLAKVRRPRTRAIAPDPWQSLTDAELRVAELVVGGMTNRHMADYLNLSPHTIDAHLKHIYTKLDIHSRVELTVLALQHG
jgi:DNA-binding CsgD family transcriptional regulator